jgi:ATP-dependent Clp protease ATP-binding subunit ClpB
LQAGGSSVAAAAQAAQAAISGMPSATGSSVSAPGLSRAAMSVLEQARSLMASMGDSFVSTDHLLLALAQ